jgi:cell division protease FtsH
MPGKTPEKGSHDKNRSPLGSPGRRPGINSKAAGFWLVLALLLMLAFQMMNNERRQTFEIEYSAFAEQVDAGNLEQLTIIESQATGRLREQVPLTAKDGSIRPVQEFKVVLIAREDFYTWVTKANPGVRLIGELPRVNWLTTFLTYYLPFLLILGLWIFFLRQMQGGSNKAFSFGKSRAKLFNMDKPEITFEDVAGCDEAKVELQEIIEFLRSPKKFQRLGGRIPKGGLLVGPPGTGKTLLGRAVAGEAGVPFFSMSGSDFVEMFVGVGASRVRDLFEQGKKNAPCIIFIDEIDAVGRHRGAGLGGGHDEREQTLNQLLVEMDGFESNDGVILLAATNRPDVLDPALLRPGRFDRQIVVDMPDINGREAILKVHMKKVRMSEGVSAKNIAAGTPGMAGADLENLVNEAALLAARKNHDEVVMEDFEDAKEKVMLGPERRSRVLSDETKKVTAYHESGHAAIAHMCPECDPVHKVTIIPRGQALGVTFMLPEKDDYNYYREKFEDIICMGLGGRAAEEIFLGRITAGAYGDIKMVTARARTMVTQLGMSDKMGPVAYEESAEQVFLGRDFARRQLHSEQTLQEIDSEVRRIVEEQLARARRLLRENRSKVETMAQALLERETLNREGVELIMRGEPLPAVVVKTDHAAIDTAGASDTYEASGASGGNGGIDPAAVTEETAEARDDLGA